MSTVPYRNVPRGRKTIIPDDLPDRVEHARTKLVADAVTAVVDQAPDDLTERIAYFDALCQGHSDSPFFEHLRDAVDQARDKAIPWGYIAVAQGYSDRRSVQARWQKFGIQGRD